jgi:hypothetical protein
MNWKKKMKPLTQKLNNRRLLIYCLGMLLACGVAFFVFSSSGFLFKYARLDLSFLLPPLIVLIVFIFASALFKLLADNIGAKLISIGVKYLGICAAIYLVFNRALLFSRFSFLSHHLDILQTTSTLSLIAVLLIVGIGGIRHAELFDYKYKQISLIPLIQSFSLIIIGAAIWRAFNQYSSFWTGSGVLSWAFLTGFWAVSLTYLLRYATAADSLLIADVCKWLTKSPASIFIIGVCTALYFGVIRGFIYSILTYAFYFEWVLILFLAWTIFRGVRKNLQKSYTSLILEADWRRHVQVVNQLVDDDFNKMLDLQAEFVDKGTRQYLLNYLMLMLHKNGYKAEDITTLLKDVIEYNDRKTPWYSWGYFRTKIQRENRIERQRALDNLLDGIKASVLLQHSPH